MSNWLDSFEKQERERSARARLEQLQDEAAEEFENEMIDADYMIGEFLECEMNSLRAKAKGFKVGIIDEVFIWNNEEYLNKQIIDYQGEEIRWSN